MENNFGIMKGVQGGNDVPINCLPFVIGRCRTADFIIAHVNVSRNHCQIIRENNVWKIHDCSSSGTYVNGVLVGRGKSRLLSKDDVIRFGPVESNLSWSFHPVNNSDINNERTLNNLPHFEEQSQAILDLCTAESHLKEKINNNKVFYLKMKEEEKKLSDQCEQLLKDIELKFVEGNGKTSQSEEIRQKLEEEKKKVYEKIQEQIAGYQKKIVESILTENKFLSEIENLQMKMEIEVNQWNSAFTEETMKLKAEIQEKLKKQEENVEQANFEKKELEEKLIKQEEEKNAVLKKLEEMEKAHEILSKKLNETNKSYILEKAHFEEKLMEKDEKVKMQIQEHLDSLQEAKNEIERKLKTEIEKRESEKTQELMKELEQVKNALNELENKNSDLQGKLAVVTSNENEDSQKSRLVENLTDLMEAELQCTICSELFVTAITLCCTHTFCKFCINQWKKKQMTCPICRKKIANETRSLVLDNYIDKMVENLSAELKERRKAIVAERNETVPSKKPKCRKTKKYNSR